MSKIKNDGLDHMALDPSNSSNLEQLAVKGLILRGNPTVNDATGGKGSPSNK